MRPLRPYLFVLILSFLLLDVSVSITLPPATGRILSKLPSSIKNLSGKNWISRGWNKLQSLFNRHLKVGDAFEGLSQIKEYYDIFNYLNDTFNLNFFTEDLQSAIKEYQENFNLSVTGQPDQTTIETMQQPRCGAPDIINGSTTMKSGKVNTTSFEPWWPRDKKELTYAFWTQDNIADIKPLFQDAFNRWSKVTTLNFTETTLFNNSDIGITFLRLDGKGLVVGDFYANSTTHVGDMYLDSEEQWLLPDQNMSDDGDLDLESVVMHQIGHLLGMGHSSVKEAIMYPIVLQKKMYLAPDDLQRIQQIYGVNANNNGSASPQGGFTAGTSHVAGAGWWRNLVLALSGGIAFLVLGIF